MSVSRSLSVSGSLITPVGYNPSPLIDDVVNRDTTTGYTQVVPGHFPHVSTNFTPITAFDALTCVDRMELVFTSTTTLIPEFFSRTDQDILLAIGQACFNVAGSIQIFPTTVVSEFQILSGGSVGLFILTFDPTPVGLVRGVLGVSTVNGVTIVFTDYRLYRNGYEVTASGGDCSSPGEGNDPSGNPNPAGGDGTGDGWGRPGTMDCAWEQSGTAVCGWQQGGTGSCSWNRG